MSWLSFLAGFAAFFLLGVGCAAKALLASVRSEIAECGPVIVLMALVHALTWPMIFIEMMMDDGQ